MHFLLPQWNAHRQRLVQDLVVTDDRPTQSRQTQYSTEAGPNRPGPVHWSTRSPALLSERQALRCPATVRPCAAQRPSGPALPSDHQALRYPATVRHKTGAQAHSTAETGALQTNPRPVFPLPTMDYKTRDISWKTLCSRAFDGNLPDGMGIEQRGRTELQSNVKRLLHRRTKVWWNRAFLEGYISKQMIPRGLRMQVFPSFPVEDTTFINKWEEICSTSSLKLMELLVGYNSKTLEEVDKELDSTYLELKTISSAEEIAAFDAMMAASSEEWEKAIRETHSKKIMRDMTDYQQLRVYRWRKSVPRFTRGRSTSVSTVSSVGEASDQSLSPMTTRLGTKRKGVMQYKMTGNYTKKAAVVGKSGDTPKVINLSQHVFSTLDNEVLARGLMFSPSSRFDPFTAVKDLHIFARALIMKKWFHDDDLQRAFPTETEQTALRILEELSEEHSSGALVPLLSVLCFDLVYPLYMELEKHIIHLGLYDKLVEPLST
ncbi:uncharacterized protein ACNLHF_006667 [Anomaloglossus baeobatrachus]|uniref:uncharacterized protein LOC142294876 n=1 Tax=Anomaloglossus baeobatrachus TaxID=238106 RepID=UPI003F50A4A0